MATKKPRNQFTFVEQKDNKGLIAKLVKLADSKERALNDFLNLHFSKLTKDIK